jgi:hypothetical protein
LCQSNCVVCSLSPPRCHLSSDLHHHVAPPCHTYFPWSQEKLAVSASSSVNASSCRFLSRAETKILNPHHPRQPPSPYHTTPTLHWYKNDISTLVTLPTTQSRLYFGFTLTRALCHRSSTHRHVPFHCRHTPILPPHNDTHGDELADPSFFAFWIAYHVDYQLVYLYFYDPL